MKSTVSERGVLRVIAEHGDTWPEALSGGSSRPCAVCGRAVDFQFLVTDEIWWMVVPHRIVRDVICLACIDRLAADKGIDISHYLLCVHYAGLGKTIILQPTAVYESESCPALAASEEKGC